MNTPAATAPDAGTGMIRVRAELRSDPACHGETTAVLLPLPDSLLEPMAAAMGPSWLEPFSTRLPFLDPETGRRSHPDAQVSCNGHLHQRRKRVAYGIPFMIESWRPGLAEGLRATYRESGHLVRRDFADQGVLELTCHGSVRFLTLEALRRSPLTPGRWCSSMLSLPLEVRGLVPLAGNPVAEPGDQDGSGYGARFRRPFGLANLHWLDAHGHLRSEILVADPQSHVIRRVDRQGAVSTLCGQIGRPGHQDSPSAWAHLAATIRGKPPEPPRFHRPTHVIACCSPGPGCGQALVADSGNHVIRRVLPNGLVSTLAGTPGQAGYRDVEPGEPASFSDPQGLAVDHRGWIYVADAGNRVLRVILPGGSVRTVAGDPDVPGSADGVGGAARFTELKGLCLDPRPEPRRLYVLDGHAVRRVDLAEARVTTVLGVVDRAGFQDCDQDTWAARAAAMQQPCLNAPTSITWTRDGMRIADHGNHAIRHYQPESARLRTVVGGPDQAFTRWGLNRDGMPGPLDEPFAALEYPTALTPCDWNGAEAPSLIVSCGRCLAELNDSLAGRDELVLTGPPEPQMAALGAPCAVPVRLDTRADGAPTRQTVLYTAEFLDPDGDCLARVQGRAAGGDTVLAVGSFAQAGPGTCLFRAVTEQGVVAWTRVPVQVR